MCFCSPLQRLAKLDRFHMQQFSDDYVSASSDEDHELMNDDDDSMDGDFGDSDQEEQEGGAPDPTAAAAAAVAAAATAAAAAAVEAKGAGRALQDALMSGQLSTQTALLQLELSELLSEVAAARQPAKVSAVHAAVGALQEALSSLPQQQVVSAAAAPPPQLSATAQAVRGVVGSMGPDAQAVSLTVSPPAAVRLVGSWADGAAVDLPGATVDVAVQLPSSCLHNKDLLNYRYHAKRALYLAQLCQHLAQHPVFSSAQHHLAALQGDPYRPVLLLQLDAAALSQVLQHHQQQQSLPQAVKSSQAAAAFGSAGLTLRLLPCAGLDCFELSKLAPSRNNIRWVTGTAAGGNNSSSSSKVKAQQQQQQPVAVASQQGAGDETLLPTPHYNAAVLQDVLLLLSSSRQEQAACAGGMRFVEASMLLKAWAHQHSIAALGVLPPAAYACYNQQQQQVAGAALPQPCPAAAAVVQADGFSGHLLSALLTAALQKSGDAAAAMSPLQMFKAALQLLADKQAWLKGGGVSLARDSSVPAELRQQQHQQQGSSAAASAVDGKVSKDHVKLLQKLQQQMQLLPPPQDAAAVFRKAYSVTLLDSSGHSNLAASVSGTLMQMAQAAAQQSLAVLNRQDLEPDAVYAAVFKPGQGLARLFHYYWTVDLPGEPGTTSSSTSSSKGKHQQQQQQHAGDQHPMRLAEVEVEGLVRAALGSRARLVKAIRRPPLLLLPAAAAADQQQQQQQLQATPQQQQHKKAKHNSSQQQPAAAAAAGACSSSSSSSVGVPRRIVVGAVVDPVAVLRLVDVGPAADDAAAASKFRRLWGDKSELRRFQDGKICEAVVWEGVPTGQRHFIPDQAVAYMLTRHLPAGTVITSCATALDPLLYASSSDDTDAAADNVLWSSSSRSIPPGAAAAAGTAAAPAAADSRSSASVSIGGDGTGSSSSAAAEETAASRAADAALDSLTKQLRALSDLALKVIGVQPLSTVTRHTCCFYPEPHPLAEGSGARAYTPGTKVPRVLEPIDVMVQLEGTGKMPLNPEAFAKTKAALGVQLASTLSSASGAHVTATEAALEVLWQGFAFKLILYLDREDTIQLGLPAAAGAGGGDGTSVAAGSSGQQSLPVLLSQHHGLVSELSAAHAAYGPTVRLAKRWLGAHLLLGSQVCEEAVELLVGAVFQGPSTCPAPASRIAGFLSFLHLLWSYPWSAAPLLIDPAGQVKQEARRALQAEFDALREAGAAPAAFLATPNDWHTSRWTRQHPSTLVMSHLVSLARTAWHTLSQLLLLGGDAPFAQQQLSALVQDQQAEGQQGAGSAASCSKKRSTKQQQQQLQNGDAAAAGGSMSTGGHHLQQQQQLEARALGRAWRVLCTPVLTGFDALVLLRKEALPFADRADPIAVQQLHALVVQQHRQQRRLTAMQQKQKQQDGVLQVLLGAAAAGGGGSVRCAAPKNARAILRSIPEQVLMSKSADKLRSELLVGFDPVNHYLLLLTQRYGHMAQFCADSSSGFPAVGIKWQPAAFLPAPLKPNLAHAQMEILSTSGAAAAGAGSKAAEKGGKGGDSNSNDKKKTKKGSSGFNSKGLVVPNLPQVLCEAAEMGLGLVEEVLLL